MEDSHEVAYLVKVVFQASWYISGCIPECPDAPRPRLGMQQGSSFRVIQDPHKKLKKQLTNDLNLYKLGQYNDLIYIKDGQYAEKISSKSHRKKLF